MIDEKIREIKEIVDGMEVVIGFSGGEDSSLVATLSKMALGKEKVTLATIDWGIFTYEKSRKIVKEFAKSLGLKHVFLDGSCEQRKVWRFGPSCNSCTKFVKLEILKGFAAGRLIMTGANSYDSWGKTGLKVFDGVYAPLQDLGKEEIRAMIEHLELEIEKIGESEKREGCKLKHLLKPLINCEYHGNAVAKSNEILLKNLKGNFKKAFVKITGPLSKNIAVIYTDPPLDRSTLEKVAEEISNLREIDRVIAFREGMKIKVVASKPIYRNPEARKNTEFYIDLPGEYEWIESRNTKLRTFQVVEVSPLRIHPPI